MQYTLTNFNAPVAVRKHFDTICRTSGRTRTSVLIELMTTFVLTEGKRLAERDKQFHNIDIGFQESPCLRGSSSKVETSHRSINSHRQTWGDQEFDLPDPIYSDGRDDW